MELCEVTVNIVFLQLKNSFNRNLTQKVISYFDFEDLKTLSLVMERTGQRNSFS